MANDVNANIRVNLDTSQALAGLQSLQSRISSFNQSVIQSNAQAVAAQRNLLNNFQAQVGASRQFSTSITNVETSVGRLQTAIDKNRLSMGQYFRYGVASSKNFGKVFRQENEAITRLATERVQKLQTQYVALGQAQGGMTKALAVRPLQMFNADSAIAIQRSQIFNKLLQDGSTSLVNWGKNTQWAGRQLMVGFTVPLTIFGGMAAKTFMELEEQAISFRKVYGDIFTTEAEVEENLAAVRELTQEMTKYGIAASETFELANIAAQSGARGADLMAQTEQATRLAVLGQMEQQEAVRTTITLQNAFQLSNEDLADSINFLNIVENQSVLSLQDVAGAIPRVAPVIKSLGGDVRDLSVMLVAMREGGVSAAEGANALKTSLARLISPTAGASKMAKELGINLNGIVEANQGDILGAVMQLAGAMEELDELSQQRLLSEIFGKRQYARVGALFNNITNEASQAQRVLDLTTMSTADLAATAEKELGAVEQSISTKFTAAVELLKTEIAPIGEQFLKLATPIVDAVGKIFAKFNDLSPTVKNFVTILAAGVGVVVPVVLMLVGLFGNLLGNLVKGFATLGQFFQRIRNGSESVEYLAGNQLEAAAAAASLEGQVTGLTGSLNIQREAIDALTQAYGRYIAGANTAAASLPQGFRTPSAPAVAPTGMASGGMVGGVGNKDTEPALLTPGEFVINADASKRFAPLLAAINEGRVGKYARGRTEGNISFGSLGSVNIPAAYGQVSIDRIQAMADDLAGAGDDVRLAFKQILEDLSQTQGLTKGMVQQAEALKSSQFPEISKMAGESKYSASKAGEKRSIEAQLREDLADRANNEQLIAQEYARAQAAIDGSIISLNEYYDGLVRNANSEEEIEAINDKRLKHIQEASRMDRAHIVELTNAQKLERESWNARLWMPQSGIENQLSNMLARSENNQAIYEQYLMDLADTSVSEDQRLQILEKVRGNIALTDSELDIQARVLQNIVEDAERNAILVRKANGEFAKMSAEFIPYAQGAIGAAGGRAAMGPVDPAVQAERIAMSQGVIGGFRDDIRANSPSEAAADVADSVPEGVAKGIKRSTPQATAAARELAQEVEGQLMMEFEDDDALFPAAPYKGERRLQPTTTPTQGRQRDPLPVAPKSVQDDLIRATQKATNGMNNAGIQASQASRRFAGLKGAATKFGGALKNGSMKMQGAFFALDGLVFAASMVNGSLGDMAQKALPVVFGLQGLTMVLPMLANPLGIAAVAVGGLIAGIIALNNAKNEARQRTIEYAIAVQGSAKAFDELAKELGGIRPSEAFAQIASGVTTEEQRETFTRGQEFIQSESGQQMMERFRMTSGQERVNAIITELTQAVGFGIIDSGMAKGVAQAIAVELKSPTLGFALVNGISDYVKNTRGQTRRIVQTLTESISSDLDNVLNQYEDTFAQEARLRELQLRQQSNDLQEGEMQELIDLTAEAQSAQDDWRQSSVSAAQAIGPLINSSQKLADAQALVNLKYREGSLDVEDYRQQTQMIEEQNQRIADSIARLIEEAPADFMPSLRRTALALGVPEEEVNAIETQYENIKASLVEDFGIIEQQAGRASQAIAAALQSGTLDPGTAGSISTLLSDTEYESVIKFAIEGQPEKLPEILNLINKLEQLPEPYRTEILMELNTDGDIPGQRGRNFLDNILGKLDEFAVYGTYFASNPILGAEAFQGLREEVFTTEQVSNAEQFLQSIEGGIENFSSAITNLDLKNLIEIDKFFADNKKLKKDAVITITGNDGSTTTNLSKLLSDANVKWNEFAALPDINKQIVITAALNLERIRQQIATVAGGLEGVAFGGGGELGGLGMMFSDALRAVEEAMNIGEDTGGFEEETDGGGGNAEESFLEGLINTFTANTKLFNTAEGAGKKYLATRGRFFGMLEKLRKEGIPEGIIAMIGTGAKGVENARELLDATAKERRQLLGLYGSVVAGEAADEIRVQQAQAQIEIDAASNLRGTNRSQEFTEFVMGNEKLVAAFAAQNRQTKEGRKTYWELVQLAEDLMNKEKDREEIQKSIADRLKDQADLQRQVTDAIFESMRLEESRIEQQKKIAFEQERGITPELLQHQIEMRNYEIQAVQDLIDEQQKSIDAEQDRIDQINRAIEMKEREIEGLERQNELDERRIETLSRQDELRNREAEGLERELSLMSEAEQKIRDAYQKRIDALDKIASINDYIVNQQRQQLDLSRAISEGDIYSATAAVQEMRASSAGFAATQVRAGLEAGMEGQVAGLRTAGGLTREQAEQRIANIQEQSYQTSLKIRDIEDRIYARNQQMIPLKDEIYNMNQQILGIEDLIYQKEQAMQEIITLQLEPLENQNKLEQGYLDLLEKEIKEETGPLAAKRQALERQVGLQQQTEDLNIEINRLQDEGIKKANRYANKWGAIASNAWSAANAAAQLAGAQLPSVNAYAGGMIEELGMGGKVKRYRGGGVVSGMQALAYGGPVYGSGGRDSVPAMLMPGEFVVRKAMVEKYGEGLMRDINMGSFAMPSYEMEAEMGTPVVQSNNMVSNINAPVYNSYDMKFSINGANQSADEIANTVMFKMRQLQNQGIRTNRGY